MSELLDARVGEFLDTVASEAPAPGGGSAAALTVALSAALLTMCARMTGAEWAESKGVVAQAERLRRRVSPLVQIDAEAYEEALVALRLPKELEANVRDATIGAALARAAEVPLTIAAAAADVAELAALVAEKGDANVRGDAIAAAVLAEAGARATATLVAVNLATTADDERVRLAEEFVAAAAKAAKRALATTT